MGDDAILYQDGDFFLPSQLLKLKKTQIREISYKIPIQQEKSKKSKKKNKRRKSLNDSKKQTCYKTMTFKIPRPIKNIRSDVPKIKGYQLDDDIFNMTNQDQTVIIESDDVYRLNMRSLQLRAFQHMTSFFQDLANVEDS